MIRSLLVANRGEIAVRIIRAAKELASAPWPSTPSRTGSRPTCSPPTRRTCSGPLPRRRATCGSIASSRSAREAGAEAIHPGYGFLAERASFAEAVEDAGLVFVGPTAETIAAMGDKTEARRRMQAAGVPIVPGLDRAVADGAAAAGSGRGDRLPGAAQGGGGGWREGHAGGRRIPRICPGRSRRRGREAQAAFGDGSVYLERYLDRPRHIEIQVLGDTHGTRGPPGRARVLASSAGTRS